MRYGDIEVYNEMVGGGEIATMIEAKNCFIAIHSYQLGIYRSRDQYAGLDVDGNEVETEAIELIDYHGEPFPATGPDFPFVHVVGVGVNRGIGMPTEVFLRDGRSLVIGEHTIIIRSDVMVSLLPTFWHEELDPVFRNAGWTTEWESTGGNVATIYATNPKGTKFAFGPGDWGERAFYWEEFYGGLDQWGSVADDQYNVRIVSLEHLAEYLSDYADVDLPQVYEEA